MELATKESGRTDSGRAKEYRFGRMDHAIKAIGRAIKQMDKASCITLTGIYTRDNGLMIKPVEWEHTLTPTERNM